MELEKFEKAKELQEKISWLERQKYKLESATKSCCLNVNIGFSVGSYGRKEEVNLKNTDNVKEMIQREIRDIMIEIDTLNDEFGNL